MTMNKICCDICGTPLGYVDLDTITPPISADQITSLMPERGVPAPFVKGLQWISLICRTCKARAFQYPDRLTLIDDTGKKEHIQIPVKKKEFVCECGRSYDHLSSLKRHQKDCNGK